MSRTVAGQWQIKIRPGTAQAAQNEDPAHCMQGQEKSTAEQGTIPEVRTETGENKNQTRSS
jgi:hypothetical protein